MLVLFESWLPSDRLESLWKGTRSAGFDGQPRHLFTDMVFLFRGWLHALLCGTSKITLWWCVHSCVRYESIRLPLCTTRLLVTQAGLSRHICNKHVCCICHLWSSALTLKNIPGSDSHTFTDVQPHRHPAKHRHGYSQLVLTKYFPLTGQFVWFLLLFLLIHFYRASYCKYVLCNQ